MEDTILIVDDESTVRQTVQEWLTQANLDCDIRAAADAESALSIANRHTIDLAVLDWNLGAGDDGLQLLQELAAFHPNIVAILITGYANMATPLDAMRMGVRDYLDKNNDFTRDTLVRSVQKQLDQIRPAKRVRRLHQTLLAFRNAVEQIVPLVQSTAALNEPVPLPEAVRGLLRFLMRVTHSRAGLLLARHHDAERNPNEVLRLYNAEGGTVEIALVPFARSVAGAAVSRAEPCVMNHLAQIPPGSVELQSFERQHVHLLAVPMTIASGTQVILELFDKEGGYSAADQHVASSAAELGTELLRQALGQRGTQKLLFDAVEAALKASDAMALSINAPALPGEAPSPQVLDRLRAGLKEQHEDAGAERTLRLAEAIRILALKHGPAAVDHCLHLVQAVQALLDQVTEPAREDGIATAARAYRS